MKLMTDKDTFLLNTIRRFVWPRWPERKKALDRCRVERYIGNRKRVYYKCERCREEFPKHGIEIHHVVEVIPTTGWDDIWDALKRLFCEAKDLELLCKACHRKETNAQNEQRKKRKT